jgi:hypothetical protein
MTRAFGSRVLMARLPGLPVESLMAVGKGFRPRIMNSTRQSDRRVSMTATIANAFFAWLI